MLNSKKDIKEKRFPKFANFGEYLFYSYANLQMLCAALNMGKKEFDRSCFMIRGSAVSPDTVPPAPSSRPAAGKAWYSGGPRGRSPPCGG